MRTLFDSADLPEREAREGWVETTALALVTTRIRFLEPELFGARIRAMSSGATQISAMAYGSLSSLRTPALIRRSDPGLYQLAVITSGRQGIEQVRRHALLEAGDMVLYDSSRPFEAAAYGDSGGRAGSVLVQFPKWLLPLPERQVDDLLAVRLPAQEGVGRLLARFLTGLVAESAQCTPRDITRLGGTVVDLVAASLAHHADREDALPAESRRHALFLRVSAFVRERVGEPDLSPAAIAAAHGISPRHLHRVFQQHGTTVSGYVKRLRLDRCRRDLADPGLGHLPVHAVGARWGFPRAADFSRAFRADTGMPPGEYRSLIQQSAVVPAGDRERTGP